MRLIDADTLKAYIDMQEGRPFIGYTIGKALKMMVDEQPTIEQEQKTGKWMTPKEYCQYLYETTGERCSPMATGLESFVYCSQCGEPSWFSKNYCPHCGARMECEEE